MALQNFPIAEIEAALDTERLMRSFSRRLGYLHDSDEAVRLVENWLAPDGKLGDPAALNDLGEAMFSNVAPVSPWATLEALERAADAPGGLSFAEYEFGTNKTAHLLRSLAYDPGLFDRSVSLLVKLAEAESRDGNRQEIASIFESLFHIYLSGTQAPIEQRARLIENLLRSNDAGRRDLGVIGLRALLKAGQFHSSYSFAFGAQPRNFGYWPASREEIEHWYASVIRMLEPLAVSDHPVAERVRLPPTFASYGWRVSTIIWSGSAMPSAPSSIGKRVGSAFARRSATAPSSCPKRAGRGSPCWNDRFVPRP